MGALGSSPTYYDFDMFQEMQVTTGGADARQPTPGVQMNFVLKSGTNTPHGSARIYFENKDLQSNNLPDDLVESLGGDGRQGQPHRQVRGLRRRTGRSDREGSRCGPGARSAERTSTSRRWPACRTRPKLTDMAAKVQAAFSPKLRANFTFFSGNKQKDGRGAGPFNPPETTWIQDGPSKMYKGESTSSRRAACS